jgi:hypothetical protein
MTKPTINSLQPVEPPFSEEVDRILESYPNREGYILKLFRVFAISERFLKTVAAFPADFLARAATGNPRVVWQLSYDQLCRQRFKAFE